MADQLPALYREGQVPTTVFERFGSAGSMPKGLGSFTPNQLGLQPGRLQIIHKVERATDIGRPGEWKFGGKSYPELEVVFLKAHWSRILREGPDLQHQQITCASTDGEHPHASVPMPKSDLCKPCPYAQWTDGPNKKRVRPRCDLSIALIGVIPKLDWAPFWWLATKSAVPPTRQLLGAIAAAGLGCSGEAVVRLRTQEGDNKGGFVYYVPVLTVVGGIEDYKAIGALTDAVETFEYLPANISGVVAEGVAGAGANGALPEPEVPWETPV